MSPCFKIKRKKVCLLAFVSIGNFFSSIAAGLILAKGISAGGAFHAEPVLVYLLASVLSLACVVADKKTSYVPRFSYIVLASLSAFVLSVLSATSVSLSATLVYFYLVLVFTCIFNSRIFRSDDVGGNDLPFYLSEFSYSAGYLVGMAVHGLFFLEIGLSQTFALAGSFCSIAALVDLGRFFLRKPAKRSDELKRDVEGKSVKVPPGVSFFRINILLFFLTVGVQITIQRLSSIAGSNLPIGAFEVGVTLAGAWFAIAKILSRSAIPTRAVSGIHSAVFFMLPFIFCLFGSILFNGGK